MDRPPKSMTAGVVAVEVRLRVIPVVGGVEASEEAQVDQVGLEVHAVVVVEAMESSTAMSSTKMAPGFPVD